jgi:predicted DCC family thiol-disulfide oxidoreductase YuxK
MTQQGRQNGPCCLLIYDGECRLCVAAKERLEQAADGRALSTVQFVPYQSAQAQHVLGARYRPGRPAVAFLVEPSGTVKEGLDAFLPFAPSFFIGRMLLMLLRVPLGRPVAELIYRVIAKFRYRLFGRASQP